MISVELVLSLIGLIILTGFVSSFLFEKLRVPDLFFLLSVGMLIGQFLRPADREFISVIAPYFGSIALLMILFEGGLELDAWHIARQFRNALVLGIVGVIATVTLVAFAAHAWLGWTWWNSLMFGAMVGSTSSAIVVPIVQRTRAPEDTRVLLSMESVLNDTVAIVILLAVVDLAVGASPSATAPLARLFSGYFVAFLVAFPVGLLWLNILEWTKGRPLSYLWTFAILLLCYVITNMLQGIGAMAVFFVGIIIGNSRYLPKWLLWGRLFVKEDDQNFADQAAHETVQWFHTELTFLIRSFFFVYMGMLFDLQFLRGRYFWLMLGFTVCIALARCIGVWSIQRKAEGPLSRPLVWAFLPRGLVSVVLATLPATRGYPQTSEFVAYTIPVIISTNLIMIVSVFAWERRNKGAPLAEAPEEEPSGV